MLMDLLFEGIIGGLECLGDAIEFGPVQAVKIKTSIIPEAERDYRRIMRDINNPGDDKLEKFSALIEDIKADFSMESDNIDLELIYDYHQLNAYGKVILDKICSNQSNGAGDLSMEERLKRGVLFKERCRNGECDKYSFIFWALMVLTVDDTDKEEHLSQICDFSKFLEINEEEMTNIVRLVCAVCRN